MIPKNRTSTHPGEMILHHLNGRSIHWLSGRTHINVDLWDGIIKKIFKVTPMVAHALSDVFDATPEFWLNAQEVYDKSL